MSIPPRPASTVTDLPRSILTPPPSRNTFLSNKFNLKTSQKQLIQHILSHKTSVYVPPSTPPTSDLLSLCEDLELTIDSLFSSALLPHSSRLTVIQPRSLPKQVRLLKNIAIHQVLKAHNSRLDYLKKVLHLFITQFSSHRSSRINSKIPFTNELQLIIIAISSILFQIKSYFKNNYFPISVLELLDDDSDPFSTEFKRLGGQITSSLTIEDAILFIVDYIEIDQSKSPLNRKIYPNTLKAIDFLQSIGNFEQTEVFLLSLSLPSAVVDRPKSAKSINCDYDWDDEFVVVDKETSTEETVTNE
ncbi:hypothetical protein P9112_004862 [Eukaryota sp. TZLM1-RC]